MSDASGTLERIAREVALALQQTTSRLEPSSLPQTLRTLGMAFPPGIATASATASEAGQIAALGGQLPDALDALAAAIDDEDDSAIIAAGVGLLAKCVELIARFPALGAALQSDGTALGMSPTALAAFTSALPERLLQALIVDHIDDFPGVAATLTALGVIERIVTPSDPASPQSVPWEQRALRLDRLLTLVSDPARHFDELYQWGDPAFDGSALLDTLHAVVTLLGLPARLRVEGSALVLEVLSLDIRRDPVGTPPGLRIDVVAPFGGVADATLALPLEHWSLRAFFEAQLDSGWAVRLRPPLDIEVLPPAGEAFSGAVGVELSRDPSAAPMLLIGQTGATRLEAGDFSVAVALEVAGGTSGATVQPTIALGLHDVRFVLALGESDSFVEDLSGGSGGLTAEIDLDARWSLAGGLEISGSAQLEIEIPINAEIGPIAIPAMQLGAGVDATGLRFHAGVDVSATLGPVFVSVRGIGLSANITPTSGGSGNAGPANVDVAFRPPSGVGLLVDAGPVSGGGYLAFYPEIGRYTGVAQLDVVGIAVRAIGIVDTILPGGEEGFSFLVLITAEFTPIQLGMGFTLNGIGGLAGIHRTLMTEPLRAGVREGTLDDILFPEDPVRDANALIARLQSIFPVKKDEYVFGVMVKLGYGTPSLVTAEIGLILKVPDPIIVLLGSISAKLPTEAAAVIDLNLDVLGILDFGQKLFSLDASLRDSRIAIFNISGDMALRLGWGDPPSFALSIGGLHPAFQPPPGFPTLRRVSISVGNGDNPRLGFEAYIALTSNSLQFGARVFLYAEAGGFSIEGYLGFDALIIFVPFSFRFDFAAGLIIKAGGTTLLSITVEGMLEGPTPWHVRGRASFCILFFEVSVDFDARFGEEQHNSLPGVARDDLLGQVRDAFKDAGNWSAALPEGEPSFVSFLEAPVPEGVVRIDPIGTLTARQKVAPLNRALSKVGESRVTDGPMTIGVPSTWLGGVSNASPDTVLEYFAPAQVEDLDDAAKLSRPSFEQMDGGVSFGVDEIAIGPGQTKDMEFETIRTDGAPPAFFYVPSVVTMLSQARRGPRPKATTQSGLSKFAPAKGTPPLVAWRGDGEYVIASVDTLARRNDILAAPTTQGAASSRLSAYVAANPSERGTVQVVPLHEAA